MQQCNECGKANYLRKERMLQFFDKNKGIQMNYSQLPINAKSAVKVYYEKAYKDDVFMFIEIPIEELIDVIGCPEDLDFKNFEEYHKWYVDDGSDIPNHKRTWALILTMDEEVILDGWHRFHSYVDKKIKIIPCVIPIDIKSLNEEIQIVNSLIHSNSRELKGGSKVC